MTRLISGDLKGTLPLLSFRRNAAQNKIRFDYVFVEEKEFEKYAPRSFGELVYNFRKYKNQERI